MKSLLGEDYEAFAKTLDAPAFRGVYVNTLKCTVEKFCALAPFDLTPTPFSKNGFYIPPEAEGIGTHPLHHAGAFYVQEPSAMSAAAALCVQEGDKVLDLCAAPGGKTTALAGALNGTGLLWSNEYVKQRAFTLLSNCERIGVSGAVISNATPAALAQELPGFFDKILVDAPCSGEGMLRREKAEYTHWNEKNILICADRQKEILHEAAKLLKGGGEIVYSTCTFNRAENEEVVLAFLESHPDFSLVPIEQAFGSSGFGLPETRRVFPKDGGEGHFVAKLRKAGNGKYVKYESFTHSPAPQAFSDFYMEHFSGEMCGIPARIGDKIYLLPPLLPQTKHLSILRAGILAGEMKGQRFVPAHALFAAATAAQCKKSVCFLLDDVRLHRYLHGEETDVSDKTAQSGYHAVLVEGIPLGFGKVSGGKCKNHYPKGLRNLK